MVMCRTKWMFGILVLILGLAIARSSFGIRRNGDSAKSVRARPFPET